MRGTIRTDDNKIRWGLSALLAINNPQARI